MTENATEYLSSGRINRGGRKPPAICIPDNDVPSRRRKYFFGPNDLCDNIFRSGKGLMFSFRKGRNMPKWRVSYSTDHIPLSDCLNSSCRSPFRSKDIASLFIFSCLLQPDAKIMHLHILSPLLPQDRRY